MTGNSHTWPVPGSSNQGGTSILPSWAAASSPVFQTLCTPASSPFEAPNVSPPMQYFRCSKRLLLIHFRPPLWQNCWHFPSNHVSRSMSTASRSWCVRVASGQAGTREPLESIQSSRILCSCWYAPCGTSCWRSATLWRSKLDRWGGLGKRRTWRYRYQIIKKRSLLQPLNWRLRPFRCWRQWWVLGGSFS